MTVLHTIASCLLPLALQVAQPVAQPAAPDQQDVPDLIRLWRKRPPPPESEDKRRSILPTIGSTPAGGTSFGVLLSRQGRSAGPESRLSVLTMGASYSTKQRTQVVARLDHPFAADKWRLVGDWRYYDFTERTYGLGSDSTRSEYLDVPQSWSRAHARFYRTIAGAFALGGGYQFDGREADDVPVAATEIESRSTHMSGVSVDALFDSRDNSINATRGVYARAGFTWYPTSLGSTRSAEGLQLESRGFWRLPSRRRQVVAVWGTAWLTTSGSPAYFELPSTGWDAQGRSARGYAAGRYRGRGWLIGEVEYRVDIMRNGLIGAVGFANTSTLSDAQNRYGRWVPAGGLGLRIKLDKRHGSNVCLDYGWGRDGSRGVFLALNEAF